MGGRNAYILPDGTTHEFFHGEHRRYYERITGARVQDGAEASAAADRARWLTVAWPGGGEMTAWVVARERCLPGPQEVAWIEWCGRHDADPLELYVYCSAEPKTATEAMDGPMRYRGEWT